MSWGRNVKATKVMFTMSNICDIILMECIFLIFITFCLHFLTLMVPFLVKSLRQKRKSRPLQISHLT